MFAVCLRPYLEDSVFRDRVSDFRRIFGSSSRPAFHVARGNGRSPLASGLVIGRLTEGQGREWRCELFARLTR